MSLTRPAALLLMALGGALACLAGPPGRLASQEGDRQQEDVRPHERGPHEATSVQPFTGIDRWVEIFDAPERDEWQMPAEVVAALEVAPGMLAADLGAGTGYFLGYLARAVSPEGMVLAIDTEPEMLEHIGDRLRAAGIRNVLPVLALPDEPFLPAGRVDRLLIVNTYHHLDNRLEYFARLRSAMRPGGKLAVVDFRKKPMPVGPPAEDRLARKSVLEEMLQAGWHLADEKDFLPYQYFLIFEPALH